MFKSVFLKTLFDMRTALLWWSIGLAALCMLGMAVYPSFQENSADLERLMDMIPDAFKGMVGGEIDFSTVRGYLSARLYSFFYPALLMAFAIPYGASFIAGEEDERTLDLLLSTPISRWRVVVEKFAALVVFLGVILVVTFLALMVGGRLVGVRDIDARHVLIGTLNLGPITLFFAALALALTGVRRGRGPALGIALAVFASSFMIVSMAEITDMPGWLVPLCPWKYYNGARVLYDGLNAGHITLLLGLTAALVALGAWGLERRDVGV